MSVWDKVKAWLRIKSSGRKPLYIVDGLLVAGSGRTNGRLNPKEQIQLLRKLSVFAEREGFDLIVVFEGHALREVAHGEEFGSRIKVFFAESSGGVLETVRKLAADYRTSLPIVVAGNRKFEEEMVALGARVMRANTFRKGMELSISTGGGEAQKASDQAASPSRRRQRGRGQRGRPAAPQPQQQASAMSASGDSSAASSSQETTHAPTAQNGVSGNKAPVDEAVRNLIDLVE